VAEPKREEGKVIPINFEDSENQTPSTSASDPGPGNTGVEGGVGLGVELAKLRAERDDLLKTLVQRQADFENYRKRTERDRAEEARRGVERFVGELIPVLDAFDLALKAHEDPAYEEYRAGVNLIRKQLWDAMGRHGVERIDAAGKLFDPHIHQAIERIESKAHPDGSVVEVYQNGYMFHGRVLRPAMVRVAVHPLDATEHCS
jgi:molecular chaperone GrpE